MLTKIVDELAQVSNIQILSFHTSKFEVELSPIGGEGYGVSKHIRRGGKREGVIFISYTITRVTLRFIMLQ